MLFNERDCAIGEVGGMECSNKAQTRRSVNRNLEMASLGCMDRESG